MRDEDPRPDFVREQWLSMNGQWRFFEGDAGWPLRIEVPFPPQSRQSGLEKNLTSDRLVYERTFQVPKEWEGKRILLHFGAVDYKCSVWINGHCAGSHQGGQTPFVFDITDYLSGQEERLRVCVVDYLSDECVPRGKQFWQEQGQFIWYTQSSGIWQSVWLEPVCPAHILWMHFQPDIDSGTVEVTYQVSDGTPDHYQISLDIRFSAEAVYTGVSSGSGRRGKIIVDVFQNRALRGAFHFTGWYWSPEHPYLFDVTAELIDGGGRCLDRIQSYFGMRKVHVQDGKVYLNNQPYYQKLLLDQGYWKDGLLTAPSQEDYIQDIRKAKKMGFNGCRKHEKVEDPVFLYWADRIGFLVWESMASFWSYTPQSGAAFAQEWEQVIQRDFNHPCIVVWNMLNESWGVPRIYENHRQQHFARALYHMAHGLDGSRLVIANDGWEMTENDICAFHTYKHGAEGDSEQQEKFHAGIKSLEGLSGLVEKPLFAKGFSYQGQPVMLTEIGGIALGESACVGEGAQEESWGYTGARDEAAFLHAYARLINSIYDAEWICGFCYTQLADIEQEQNGLLDACHQYKVDAAKLKEINDRRADTNAFSTV